MKSASQRRLFAQLCNNRLKSTFRLGEAPFEVTLLDLRASPACNNRAAESIKHVNTFMCVLRLSSRRTTAASRAQSFFCHNFPALSSSANDGARSIHQGRRRAERPLRAVASNLGLNRSSYMCLWEGTPTIIIVVAEQHPRSSQNHGFRQPRNGQTLGRVVGSSEREDRCRMEEAPEPLFCDRKRLGRKALQAQTTRMKKKGRPTARLPKSTFQHLLNLTHHIPRSSPNTKRQADGQLRS